MLDRHRRRPPVDRRDDRPRRKLSAPTPSRPRSPIARRESPRLRRRSPPQGGSASPSRRPSRGRSTRPARPPRPSTRRPASLPRPPRRPSCYSRCRRVLQAMARPSSGRGRTPAPARPGRRAIRGTTRGGGGGRRTPTIGSRRGTASWRGGCGGRARRAFRRQLLMSVASAGLPSLVMVSEIVVAGGTSLRPPPPGPPLSRTSNR
mmetsp:Transcript_55468/g.117947  ORF Transcript_55468/g.117947 Transcript_55468/m.117947 type:complete len:205 (-) Transcript_55468:208-822(-)